LPKGVMAKDVILHCIGDIGFDGATYRAMQFQGPGATSLTIDDRMTITNMAIEAGGKNGIFEPDKATFAYVDARTKANGTKTKYDPLFCDPDAGQKFVYDKKFDLSKLEPTVACHPNPGNRKLARELANVQVDRAYIGSCTGGKTSDFLAFAEVIKGHKVRIDTFGVPATPDAVRELHTAKLGGKTVWQILQDAGVQLVRPIPSDG